MSAFIGLLDEQYVLVATDTLTRYETESTYTSIKPLNFSAKTFHLPQFKSIFATTGLQMIAFTFERFLSEHYIGKDIRSLTAINIDGFVNYLKKEGARLKVPSSSIQGSIFLYGLNVVSGKFEGYRVRITPTEIQEGWVKLGYITDGALTMSPGVEDYWDKWGEDSKLSIRMKKLMVLQKEDDDNRPVMEQAGIGGEIILTQLQVDEAGQIIICTQTVHTFPDYDQHFKIMMQAIID